MGASAVGVLPCQGRCSFGQDKIIAGRVAYCQEFLQAVGAPAAIVSLSPAQSHSPRGEGEWVAVEEPFDHTSAVNVLVKLAQVYKASPDLAFSHPHSPLGVIEVREDACTGCGMCAMACPTDALSIEQRQEGASLDFDATLCTACGQCLPRCPETESNAITLSRRTDLERIEQGRTSIFRTETTRCVACGAPIAPGAMIKRIEALLGSEFAATMPILTRYCIDCRSTSTV
jgi:ferredoxin